jgi:hypothetical protein
MSKKAVRNLFIGAMIFLPLQYAVVGLVGLYDAEPWPAFVFPGFKSVPVFDGAFETEQIVFELLASNPETSIIRKKPSELFPHIPVSQLSGFMRQNFTADLTASTVSEEGKEWLLEQARQSTEIEIVHVDLVTIREFRRFSEAEMVLDSVSVVRRYRLIGDLQ